MALERNVILGIGNVLCRDEGFGVHALHLAEKMFSHRLAPQAGVEWLDGGVMGLDLLAVVEECSRLLVLDAIDAGAQAGQVITLEHEPVFSYQGVHLSEHQVSFQQVLALASLRGALPVVLKIIGVQPADLATGYGCSEAVTAALPEALQRVERSLAEWG